METNWVSHCLLCDHRQFSLQQGSTCALSGSKPDFEERCPHIKLEQAYEQRIRELNVAHHLVRISRAKTLVHFIAFLTIGLLVLLLGYFLWNASWSKGYISTVPIIVLGLGFSFLPLAVGPLNKYRQDIALTRRKKQELDEVLRLYNVAYTIGFEVQTDILGNQEVSTDLRFTRKHYR